LLLFFWHIPTLLLSRLRAERVLSRNHRGI